MIQQGKTTDAVLYPAGIQMLQDRTIGGIKADHQRPASAIGNAEGSTQGRMYRSEKTPDGRLVGADGALIEGA